MLFYNLNKFFLKYIHDEGLVHGNLKAENFIFENDNDDSNVKISDIALYPLLDRELLKHTISTSPQYCGKFFLYRILKSELFIFD